MSRTLGFIGGNIRDFSFFLNSVLFCISVLSVTLQRECTYVLPIEIISLVSSCSLYLIPQKNQRKEEHGALELHGCMTSRNWPNSLVPDSSVKWGSLL